MHAKAVDGDALRQTYKVTEARTSPPVMRALFMQDYIALTSLTTILGEVRR